MSATTLSFRASAEFAEETKALASLFNMPSSEYLRDAVREKNAPRVLSLGRRSQHRHRRRLRT